MCWAVVGCVAHSYRWCSFLTDCGLPSGVGGGSASGLMVKEGFIPAVSLDWGCTIPVSSLKLVDISCAPFVSVTFNFLNGQAPSITKDLTLTRPLLSLNVFYDTKSLAFTPVNKSDSLVS